jgi:hypothetical protein
MPLSLAEKAKLQKLYNDLTDRVLSPGDPVYVDEVNARRPDDVDTVEVMATEIKWQEGGGVCLFTGQRGTGKSTELLRLKKLLEDGGAVVFYADLSEYLLLTKEIEITDFLVSIAGALSEKLDARYGRTPGKEGYWERFVRFLQTDVQLNEVKAGYGGSCDSACPGWSTAASFRSRPKRSFTPRIQCEEPCCPSPRRTSSGCTGSRRTTRLV